VVRTRKLPAADQCAGRACRTRGYGDTIGVGGTFVGVGETDQRVRRLAATAVSRSATQLQEFPRAYHLEARRSIVGCAKIVIFTDNNY